MLLADSTGYTSFLASTPTEVGGSVTATLLEELLGAVFPPFKVANIEGDAVFSYGIDGNVLHGQAFVESIEASYVEFRRALELMVLNTSL